ncbi:hypothetical protein ACTHSJ_25805 [Paenibacillus cellulositrophicus]|uniref:hypothetical protein n=1 Tax=Paenibacillus cellulositrophicus TaxID=562959 RepID=UPI003F8050CB
MTVQEVWIKELEERLEQIDSELKQKRDLSTEIRVKHKLSEEAARYMSGDSKVSGYISKNFVTNLELQHQENEDKIQELLDERRAVQALVEVIRMH